MIATRFHPEKTSKTMRSPTPMKRIINLIFLLSIVALIGGVCPVDAAVATLTPVADGSVREDIAFGGANGTTTELSVGRLAGGALHGMLVFDLTAIPQGASITSAQLVLQNPRRDDASDTATITLDLHAMTTELYNNASTWAYRIPNSAGQQDGIMWTTAGGTYDAPVLSTLDLPVKAATVPVLCTWNSSGAFVTAVQQAVGSNLGLLLKMSDEGTSSGRKAIPFASREHTTGIVPQLIIEYVANEKAGRADDFVESLGVNIKRASWRDYATPYSNVALVESLLGEVGIRYYRTGAREGSDSDWVAYRNMFNNIGARGNMLMPYIWNPQAPNDWFGPMLRQYADVFVSVEGPNEMNAPGNIYNYNGVLFPEGDVNAMRDLSTYVRGHASTQHLKLISPSMYTQENAPVGEALLKGKIDDYTDYVNLHSYAAGGQPIKNLDNNINNAKGLFDPPRPIVCTESGWFTVPNLGGVTEKAQGKYYPRMFAEYWNRGILKTYAYELIDELPDPDKEDPEMNFGLVRYDGSRKPAFTAMKNLTALLAERGQNSFATGALNFTLGGAGSEVHHTLLQKSTGEFYLLLWQEVRSFGPGTPPDIDNAPVSLSVSAATPIHSPTLYRFDDLGNMSSVNLAVDGGNTVSIDVPDTIVILKFTSSPGGDAPPLAPSGLTASMAGGVGSPVQLSWDMTLGAESYTVSRGASSEGPFISLASGIDTTSYHDSSGTTGSYYVVTANNTQGDGPTSSPVLPTLTMDNADSTGVTITGSWTSSTNVPGYYGSDSIWSGDASGSVKFTPNLSSGNYSVWIRWSAAANRGSTVPIDVTHDGGTTRVLVDQRVDNGVWKLLGVYNFAGGAAENVLISTVGAQGLVAADAVMFVPVYYVAPTAPVGLRAATGHLQVALSWNASPNVTGYSVKRATTSGGPYATIAPSVAESSYVDTSVVGGTTYYYVVSGSNPEGESPDSGEVAALASQITATITLGALSQTYNGSPRPVTVSTDPLGLEVVVTYDGNAEPPTGAGSYAVAAAFSDPSYAGSASGTLVVAKASGAVTLGNLFAIHDGTPKTASATTTPADLATQIMYNGGPTAPSNAGTYAVTATIDDANHTGSASGTLTIVSVAQPSGGVVQNGSPRTLSVVVSGEASFQWRKDGVAIPGATASTFALAGKPSDAGVYDVVITMPAGEIISDPATVTITPDPDSSFAQSSAIVMDASGTLYVADASRHVIQAIAPGKNVTTFAGMLDSPGAVDGTGTAAKFNTPAGLVSRSGTLYVADAGNNSIRTVALSTRMVSTLLSGTIADTTKRLSNPSAIAVDAAGNVYVADTGNHVIRLVSASGTITTLAGAPGVSGTTNASGTQALFNAPAGIALLEMGGSGTLYVADTGNHTIRAIALDGGAVSTVAGQPATAGSDDGPASAALLNEPRGLVLDGPDLYFVDTGNSLVRKLAGGEITTIAGYPGIGTIPGVPGFKDGSGTNAWFSYPEDITMGADGTLYVADTGNKAIRSIDASDNVVTLSVTATTSGSSQPPGGGSGNGGGGGGGALSLWALALLTLSLLCRRRMR
ncbi:hypothetical protein AW736_02350 [Termitidicoccus mucosus]|uniref:Fibronectin type-III domain-containing protein n=1 Tax=Termitidicoccus mucosus TaxID=1184151 RepID=A0A178IPN0_9BACT|nr:hypothetical protein AW736_02350 [Opitutaceae bacterium TSB47]